MELNGKSVLLVITGGIAAYKSLELIRLIRGAGAKVQCVLSDGGAKFITPLSVAALSGKQPCTDLWSLKDETEMGHIRLSRDADLIVVAPASANIIAQMAGGLAQDLASTLLLAANKPILIAPAMNCEMWKHPATQANIETLRARGVLQTGPEEGDMACGECGSGRMSEPETILQAVVSHFQADKPLTGRKALVTSGPTYEPIDPVRFIGNRSSGRQGHAIAQALADAGAAVTLVTGPVSLPDPQGVKTIHIETAQDMLNACENALPADIAVCAAAVSDWRSAQISAQKIKKSTPAPPTLNLTENPDILATIAQHKTKRPALVIGFAAETENVIQNAKSKLQKKQCDLIVANDVSGGTSFGRDENTVTLIDKKGTTPWPSMSKTTIAKDLVHDIISRIVNIQHKDAAE